MKRLFVAAIVFLAYNAFGQGSVRRVDTIADLLLINPSASGTSGKLSVEVSGYRAAGDWGPVRTIRWVGGSVAATNLGCSFESPSGVAGRWIADDCDGGTVNVSWFGADSSGALDSTLAFQAAIDKVESMAGGVVNVPVGTFRITNTISSTIRLRLIGASAESSKIVHSGSSTNVMLKLSGTSPWEVSGLTFNGDGTAPAIESYLTAEGLLTKCNIHSFKYFGFKLGSVFNRIAFNRFRDAADTNAVGLLNSMPGSGNTIIGNSFGTSAIGIRMDEPSNGLMIGPGNAFEYNTYGILIPRFAGGIYGGVQDMTIMGNFFEGCTNSPLSIGWGPYTTNSYGHQAFFIGPNAFAQTGNGPIYLDSVANMTVADHNFGPVVRFGTNFTMLHLRNNTYLSATNKVIDYDALKGKLLDQDGVVFVNAGNPPNTNEFKPYFLSGSLGLVQPNPQTRLDVFGSIRSTYGGPLPTNGSGLEMFFQDAKGIGVINSIDRGSSSYLPLQVGGRYVVGAEWQFIRWPANTVAAMSNPPASYGALWFTNVSGGTNMALVVRSPSGTDVILGSGVGVGGVTNLNDLSDVDTNSIAVNSILKWNGTNWIMGTDQSTAGTNSSSVFVNLSTQVDGPSFNTSSEIGVDAAGTNITMSLVNGSIDSNKLNSISYNWIERPKGVYVDAGTAMRLEDSGEILFTMSGATSAIAGYVDYSLTLPKIATNTSVAGDILYRSASAWTNLSIGASGKVLKVSGGLPSWQDDSTGGAGSLYVNGTSVTNIKDSSNIVFTVSGSEATPDLSTNLTLDSLTVTNFTIVNPVPAYAISNATASRFAIWGPDYLLTNDIAETGSGAPVRAVGPALTGNPTAPTQSIGTSNTTIATTAFVLQNSSTNGTTYTFSTGLTNAGGTVSAAIAPGSGVTFTTNSQTITIASTGTSYTFTNGLTNVAGVVSSSLVPGSNITLTTNAGAITIASTASGTAYAATNGVTLTGTNFSANLLGAGTVSLSTNAGVVTITGTSVTNAPVYGLWQTLGSVDFVVVQYGTTNAAFTYTNYSGVVSNISNIGDTGTDSRLQIRIDFNQNIGTNYLVFADFDGVDDLVSGQGTLFYSQETGRTNTYVELSIVDNGGYQYADYGHKIRIRIIKPDATAGGMGGDVITTANNVMSGSNSFTGPVVIGSTNLVTELAGKQPLDTDLTALANGTAIPTAITNSVSVGAPTLYAGTTNVASSLAGKFAIAGGTMTGAASNSVSFGSPILYAGTTNVASALAGKFDIAGGTMTGSLSNTVRVGSPELYASSKLTIPQSDDPDVAAAGEISWDTDGWLRAYDGANQVAIGRKLVQIDATVYKPNDLDDAQRDALWIWSNRSGMNFVITGWAAESTSDNTDITIKTMTSSGGSITTVDAVSITTDGTSMFYGSDTTITSATIANGNILFLDFDDTDTPSLVHITIYGYYDANVN